MNLVFFFAVHIYVAGSLNSSVSGAWGNLKMIIYASSLFYIEGIDFEESRRINFGLSGFQWSEVKKIFCHIHVAITPHPLFPWISLKPIQTRPQRLPSKGSPMDPSFSFHVPSNISFPFGNICEHFSSLISPFFLCNLLFVEISWQRVCYLLPPLLQSVPAHSTSFKTSV